MPTATTNLAIPSVHANGTSKGALIQQLSDAWDALEAARTALRQAAPNGRDYYPQGPDAIEQATAQHLDRLRRIDGVQDELQEMMRMIDEQGR